MSIPSTSSQHYAGGLSQCNEAGRILKTIALTRWTFVGKVLSLLFNMLVQGGHSFSSKKQVSFNFLAAVTIGSNFGAEENKVCHCFHCFPIYLL